MLRALLGLLGLLAALQVQAARTTTPLDGAWRFQRADAAGAEAPTFDDSAWTTIALPHTYNAVDGETGGTPYRGAAWYRRTLDVAPGTTQRRFLEFDATTLAADVWVNGRHAGRHEGGYARFRFDITALLQPGHNVLAVRVDNAKLPQVAPLGGDFTVFGGLIRPVRLIETATAHIELLDHGGPGVSFDIEQLDADHARLKLQVQLRNDAARPAERRLRLTLRDAQGRSVAQQLQPLRLPAGATHATAVLEVARPHLWQGIKDPYLYRLSAELLDGRDVADAVQLPVGLRRFGVDPERGFLLNGQPYPLYGVNYFHAGRPGRGVAVGKAEIDEDLRLLMDLGLTGLRLVHYQHPADTYERADELGLVLWTEIPLNSAMAETPAFRENLYGQLRELVRQNRHHASVAVWGVGNEVYRSDEPIRALLADLHALAKQEDPSRLTSYAHCCAPDDHPMALQTDLASYNRYWGWYDGQFTDVGPWADKLHAKLPTKPIGLGEYGAGASAVQQEDPPRRPEPGGRWHPEQYQALFHEAYAAQLEKRPYLWGRFIWLGFDHAAANRHEGDTTGRNDKGLVTYDRRSLKDAYHLMRAWWSPKPALHIASQRLATRPAGPVTIKAYSNAAKATLQVNGRAVGTVDVVDRVAVWPAVELAPGTATLEVSDDRGSRERVDWQVQGCGSDALGTSRVLQLPRDGTPYGGHHSRLPLAPNEFVLTFDDGPRPGSTERVLQALQAECARATFFMNGEPLLQHPALAQRVRSEGHTVAMHGYKHAAFGELPAKEQLADLEAMQKAYRYVLGGDAPAWRFPYLAETPDMLEALRKQNVAVLSVETGVEDWLQGQTPEGMADRLLKGLRQTGGGIVLLHDVQDQTAAALPLMLRRLRQDGWKLVHLQWPEAGR